MAKQEFQTYKGHAVYPWLNKPDTDFNPEGVYKTGLRVPGDQARELMAACQELAKDEFGKKAANAHMPFKIDDEETNEVLINAKSKYLPKFYDSQGQIIPPTNVPELWGGSVLRLGGTMSAYNSGGRIGVSLQLGKVQIIEVAERRNGASDTGFAPVEGGFIASNDDQETTFDNEEGSEDYNF